MPLEIATIFITSDKAAVLRKFEGRKFLQGLAPELGRTFQGVETKLLRDLTGIAYDAARSVIPVYKSKREVTVQFFPSEGRIRIKDVEISISKNALRNFGLDNNISKINKTNPVGRVFIQDVPHDFNYYRFGIIVNDSVRLANLLNIGTYTKLKYTTEKTTSVGSSSSYKRSSDSNALPGFIAIPKGSPTKGWIIEANKQKEDHFQRFLSTDKNIQAYTASL